MAEFALGLTKTAVAGTVSRVKSAIEEEANLRVRVQDDLVFISGELEMMQAFLSASGAGERASKNQVVRMWVRQLRDLAFDVEDCVEFVVHLDNKTSRWDWVRRLASSFLVCMSMPPLPLDAAVEEIKRLKARVEDVSQRNIRYKLITSGGDDQQILTQTAVGGASSSAATFQALRKVWKDTGKLHNAVSSSDLNKLIDCQGSELQLISLWGSPQADAVGQLGWKAMMKQAYDDAGTCREFKNRAWVKPTHPFDPVEFLNTLLCHFTSHLHRRRHDDMSELVRQVSQHKYLIVLEQELSSITDWDAIRLCLPDGNNGSRIVVCTRHLGIALACTREPFQVWELRPFFRDQYLFAIFPKGRGHRIGMGQLYWQLRRPGVVSLLWNHHDDRNEFMQPLRGDGWRNYLRGPDPDGVEFEHCCLYDVPYKTTSIDMLFELADKLLRSCYPEEKLKMMSSQDRIARSRMLLTEHNWFVCISIINRGSMDWDLIKRELLHESTRGSILVVTKELSVANYCVDHESRVLDVRDLLRGSHHRGHGDQGGEIEEEDKSEPRNFVGSSRCAFSLALENNGVVSFWGIAGVGKSASVRERYYEEKTHSRKKIGWVDVPHPFDMEDMCRRLLLDFYSDEAKEAVAIAMMEGQDPTQWCSKILHENKFVLVLDGLQSKHDWDLIKAALLCEPITPGGTTVVITREESIATHCTVGSRDIHNIKGLDAELALDLFTEIALDGKQLSSRVAEILNIIICKCGGLPEIITAVASGCRDVRLVEGSLGLGALNNINDNFMYILEELPDLKGLFCWMQSYFDSCSDELKPCIFYLSVFPLDQSIRRRRLGRRWIAEGYSSGGGASAVEKKGEEHLFKLVKLSILYKEQETIGKLKSCKVNGFFGSYIKSRPMEDNLVFALEGCSSPSSGLTGQHLTIRSSWDRDEAVFNSIDLSRLRSLTVFGVWKPFLTSEKMRLLRVLDLEGTNTSDDTTYVTDDHLEEMGKMLHRLKFLSLRGCQQITRLPDSLGDMRQLQTLDVRYTSIVELPSSIITKLHKLQYIRAGAKIDTSLLLVQTETEAPTPTPPPSIPPPTLPQQEEDSHGCTSPVIGLTAALPVAFVTEAWKRKARGLVGSTSWWQCKKQLDLRRRRRVAANGGGVEVCLAAAKGVWRLTDMHTLGVVNVAVGKGAFLFLEEVKKLTQLRKLGLSGINRNNWDMLCNAISSNLPHLESLSLQLMLLEEEGGSFDFACFDHIAEPPKTLKSLKVLYTTTTTGALAAGVACINLSWLAKLPHLSETFGHEVRISSQEDIRHIATLQRLGVRVVHIKPIEEHLSFENDQDGREIYFNYVDSLKIECSGTLSPSKVTFGDLVRFNVDQVSIHCCCSSSAGTSTAGASSCSLQIAKFAPLLEGRLGCGTLTVTGTYADGLERDLLNSIGLER